MKKLGMPIAMLAGIAFTPMHARRGKCTDEERLELVRHIRGMAP